MRSYIIRRVLLMIPGLFLLTVIVFSLVRFIPGSVVDLMAAQMGAEGMTAEQRDIAAEHIRHQVGLDVPAVISYGRWLGVLPHPDTGFSGILEGNFGTSLWGGWNIRDEIRHRLPVSLELTLLAEVTALCIALPIGIYSAIRQDTMGDYGGRMVAIVFMSVPIFWVGTMVTVYPAIYWGWSPPIIYIPLAEDPLGNLAQFLLPSVIQGMYTSGSLMRMTRTMMLEVLRQDYIRTAWAKGLSERTIIYRHVLKNAMIPVITQVGNMIPVLIGGFVIIETIFNLPGIGELMLASLNKRDYPVISAINLFIASLIFMTNLLVDLSYAWFDPRVVYK